MRCGGCCPMTIGRLARDSNRCQATKKASPDASPAQLQTWETVSNDVREHSSSRSRLSREGSRRRVVIGMAAVGGFHLSQPEGIDIG
jgi:hypothetical protein